MVHGQAVKVPVSDALWSTWRRYFEAIGVSMGEAVAGLITHELETVVGSYGTDAIVFAEQGQRLVKERALRLDARHEHLREWEHRLQTRERLVVGCEAGRRQVATNCALQLWPEVHTLSRSATRVRRASVASVGRSM